jgi:adenylosuccinate synthase
LRACIIVDLGFGDSGKGLLTDFFARRLHAGIVVRYNGGAQAGHNVVTRDGRHHTFSQFGSGTFIPGVKTFLSGHVVIHPSALLVEGDVLVKKGISDAFSRLRISEQAPVITPFHQAANHIREIARGSHRHGSCGVGVGETVEDALLDPENCIRAGDLCNPARLRQQLRAIRELKKTQLLQLFGDELCKESLLREWKVFTHDEALNNWLSTVSRIGELGLVVPDEEMQAWLQSAESVIFEGAQGVLLDQDAGFHPYTTWSRCTAENALELIHDMAPGAEVFQVGVMRSHAIRHGPGPLPTETGKLHALINEHNQTNDWQGRVRYGWFDPVLARYALDAAGGLDCLAITHMDILSQLENWQYCTGYAHFHNSVMRPEMTDGLVKRFHLPRNLPIKERTQFTQSLAAVSPVFETCEPREHVVVAKIESLLGQPVGLVSDGNTAEHVKPLISF